MWDRSVAGNDLVAFGAALAIAAIGTRAIELIARSRNLYAQTTPRGAHLLPTPRLGGAAIAAGTLAGLMIATSAWGSPMLVLLVGGAALLVIGIVDDLRTLPVLPRYLVQIAVAACSAVALSPDLHIAFPYMVVDLAGWPAVVVATIWIAALINVFNFMDGIDGIAAGTAAATMPAAIFMGGSAADALSIGLGGACIGFLIWNIHPASIFMGDGGSQLLGYVVAVAFLIDAGPHVQTVPVVLALAPFLIDASATLVRRAIGRKNLIAAHSDHLYQRLVRSGISQRLVSGSYILGALACGWLAIGYDRAPPIVQVGIIGAGGMWWAFVAARVPNPEGQSQTC